LEPLGLVLQQRLSLEAFVFGITGIGVASAVLALCLCAVFAARMRSTRSKQRQPLLVAY